MLDGRQQRERECHADFAQRQNSKAVERVAFDVIERGPRRPWNGLCTTYDLLMAENLHAKRVVVPGCGFGDDVIRLSKIGAEVHDSNLSPDLLDIARARAVKMGVSGLHFEVMPAEKLTYPDDFFDIVYFNDILHHVDIPKAVAEARRVLKSNGNIIANELYTRSLLQRVRENRFVFGFIYRRIVKFVYGTDMPYIAEDEHKIVERELAVLENMLDLQRIRKYFVFLGGRVVSKDWLDVAKFDRAFCWYFVALIAELPAGFAKCVGVGCLAAVAEEACVHSGFEVGDIQLLNNRGIHHGRTSCADGAPLGRNWLVRQLWWAIPNSRRLPEGFETLRGDTTLGAVHGGAVRPYLPVRIAA